MRGNQFLLCPENQFECISFAKKVASNLLKNMPAQCVYLCQHLNKLWISDSQFKTEVEHVIKTLNTEQSWLCKYSSRSRVNLAKLWFCLDFCNHLLSFAWFNICNSMHGFDIWNGFVLNLVLLVYVCMIQYAPNEISRKSTQRCARLTCIAWLTCITCITNISSIMCIKWIICITRNICITFIMGITFITCVLLVSLVSLVLLDLLNIWRRKKITDPLTTSNQEMIALLKKMGLEKIFTIC